MIGSFDFISFDLSKSLLTSVLVFQDNEISSADKNKELKQLVVYETQQSLSVSVLQNSHPAEKPVAFQRRHQIDQTSQMEKKTSQIREIN